MGKRTPLIGGLLKGHRGANDGYHKQTMAIIWRNLFNGNEIFGHLPLNINKVISCFWVYLVVDLRVAGKRINLGDGHGLEIPFIFFHGSIKGSWVVAETLTDDM